MAVIGSGIVDVMKSEKWLLKGVAVIDEVKSENKIAVKGSGCCR